MKAIGSLPPAVLHALPDAMVDELGALRIRHQLDLEALRRLCSKYADHLRAHGLVPEVAPYTLAHHLEIQR